jgi:hypothetical protein
MLEHSEEMFQERPEPKLFRVDGYVAVGERKMCQIMNHGIWRYADNDNFGQQRGSGDTTICARSIRGLLHHSWQFNGSRYCLPFPTAHPRAVVSVSRKLPVGGLKLCLRMHASLAFGSFLSSTIALLS